MPRSRTGASNIDAASLGLALLLCGLPLAAARAEALATDTGQPVQIQADSGIEWQQNAHLYIARGNAMASQGSGEVHADTLIAYYREAKGGNAGGNTEVYRVEAQGHVLLKRGTQTVVGDHAIDDIDRSIALVTGKGLKLTTPTDTVTARDSLEWYDQKQIAVARGDAVAIRNGKMIKADVLTAYMVNAQTSPSKAGAASARPATRQKPAVAPAAAESSKTASAAAPDSKISRVDAQGHVVVRSAVDTGRGDFGVYNAETGIATLIGNVVIERGKDVIRGQKAVMDLNKNISRMLPGGAPEIAHQRVQGLFVRREARGAPAAATAAPGHGTAPAGDKKP